ncbi:MAG TPA: bifunctional phosphoserine phosphatase/homoserine phosphotransferase ThrH, partial [Desulfobacterales bacterium]|nr:bifunctional phosphoserine phosphatase/homoserine phosphotransferase ThrH [Desulfobacterales bacterium]
QAGINFTKRDHMHIICSDLEGIFTPEIWINVAEKTGIEKLKLTTRDISDYDILMKKRLSILDENGIKLKDITKIIQSMKPLDGAVDFLNWLRKNIQVIIVSDTFVEFAGPLLEKLGWPTLFCHSLSVGLDGSITGYNLRQQDGKQKTAISLKHLNYRVIGIGDSYNDISMLMAADSSILFRPPDNIKRELPKLPVSYNYDELKNIILKIIGNRA